MSHIELSLSSCLQVKRDEDCCFQKTGKKVLHIERNALIHLDQYINHHFSHACEKIFNCQGKLVVMGIGKSGHIGRKIASTFASTGTPAFFIHPTEANHGDLGMVTSRDIVLAISNSGEANEILSIAPILKRQKIFLIGMSRNPKSNIGKIVDIHLCIKVPEEACPLGLAPTTSTTATLVMGDALAVALLKKRRFTPQNFALCHPGGFLGRKLLVRVGDIMHSGTEIPQVNLDANLRDVLLEITQKKLGLTVICYDRIKIAGVFTDGDLRRVLSDNKIDLNNTKISEVMTSGGIRITSDKLAVEALNLMQEHNITVLLVVEGENLLGVVHMHDLLKFGIV